MYCPNCGKEFGNGAYFCPGCGYSVMLAGNNKNGGNPARNRNMRSQNPPDYRANQSMGSPYQQQDPSGRGTYFPQIPSDGNQFQQNMYGENRYQRPNVQPGNTYPQRNSNGRDGFRQRNTYGQNQQFIDRPRTIPGPNQINPGVNPINPGTSQIYPGRPQRKKSRKIWIILPIVLLLLVAIAGGSVFVLSRSTEEIPGTYVPDKKNLASEKEQSLSDKEKELPSLQNCKVGEHIFFGEYEQDNNLSNGKGAIEWIILAKDENGALIITKDCIDAGAFSTEEGDTNWENSTVRSWLNNEFRQEAFSADELSLIECRTIENKANSAEDYQSTGSAATQDSIFLLSQEEVYKYMDTDAKRKAAATKYAEAKGVSVDSSEGGSCWWLRTPGFLNEEAAHVMTDGKVLDSGSMAYLDNIGIRPAMWITMG